MTASLPKFDKPPIHEVAIGVRFPNVDGLNQAHIGLFWSQIKNEFGRSEEVEPLPPAVQPTAIADWATGPRTWLIHNDETSLLQLQPSAFFFNWRRVSDDDGYPSYSTLKPKFYTYLRNFLDFLSVEDLPVPGPFVCSLAYVNFIPDEPNENVPNWFQEVLPDLRWRESDSRFLSKPQKLIWQVACSPTDGANELVINLQTASRKTDGRRALRLELSVASDEEMLALGETEDWFDVAHETIVRSFADLTSHEAQYSVWERVDVAS